MKILIPILLFSLSTGLTFGQETLAPKEGSPKTEEISDETYEEIVNEMCSCFNTATKGISDEMRKVIEDAGKNGANLGEEIGLYFENATNHVEEDIAILTEMGGDELMNCIENLESTYENVDIDSSEDVLMKFFEKAKGCALTYAFLLEGLRQ